MENKKSSTSWLILGATFIIILFVFGYMIKFQVFAPSGVVYTLISAIFGFGGTLFLVIGIAKVIVEKLKKK